MLYQRVKCKNSTEWSDCKFNSFKLFTHCSADPAINHIPVVLIELLHLSKNRPSFDIYATIWNPLVIHLFINLLIGFLMNTNATVTCFT